MKNGTDDFVALVEHQDADAWTTWQATVTNSNVGSLVSLAANGSDIYVFYIDSQSGSGSVVYDKYDGSTWSGEVTLEEGSFFDGYC